MALTQDDLIIPQMGVNEDTKPFNSQGKAVENRNDPYRDIQGYEVSLPGTETQQNHLSR